MKSTSGGSESKLWPVVRVATGNFLEMYDFMVFGYYAAAIGKTFFPGGNEFASLMKSLMTFGAGYLMRPLGAIVLGLRPPENILKTIFYAELFWPILGVWAVHL